MPETLVPIRWPGAWKDPTLLEVLKGTVVNCLLLEKGEDFGAVADRAHRDGMAVLGDRPLPAGVALEQGEWPGVKITDAGTIDRASAGPTGVPWVDSNGWKIRLASARHPEKRIWLDASPEQTRLSAQAYQVAVADAAAHGGSWIISLDGQLAAGMAARRPEAMEVWAKITGATGFFAAHRRWNTYAPAAVIGIISDFSGSNEFMGRELLNLIARTNQQYRVLLKDGAVATSLDGLRAVLYADEEPPSRDLREKVLAFVRAGGMLITGPAWGGVPGAPARDEEHPRYSLTSFGDGKIAVATPGFEDPYLAANDSVVLVSHRHDLLRFWNGGAVGSYMTRSAGGRHTLVHLLFYSLPYWGSPPSMRVSGRYRSATFYALDGSAPRGLDLQPQGNGVELHLPRTAGYAAVELEGVSGENR